MYNMPGLSDPKNDKENNENNQVRQQINKNAKDTCLYVVLCMIELYCKDLCQCGTVLCST